jgi:hypothetical protein
MKSALLPHVPPIVIPVEAIKYGPLIKSDMKRLAPELPELARLAEQESRILAAADQFTTNKAREDHKKEATELAADPTPENLQRLKSIGSVEARMSNYAEQHSRLRSEAEKLRRQAADPIRSVSIRLLERLEELATSAESEERAVFEKWNVPTSFESRVRPHFIRAQQELAFQVRDHDEGRFHLSVGAWIKRFLSI